MLHEDDDPLGSSMFDYNPSSNPILGNTMSTSMFSSQFVDEDPWGSHTTPNLSAISTTTPAITHDINRSFTAPNLYSNNNDIRTSDAANHRMSQYSASTVLCKYYLSCIIISLITKNRVAGIRLPEIYEQLFSQNQRSGRVSLSTLNTILSKGNISANHIETVNYTRN